MLNPSLHLPRHRRRNPGWLTRLAKGIGRLRKRLQHYAYYRGLHQDWREAWDKAGRTL